MDSFDKWYQWKLQQKAAEDGNEMADEALELATQFPKLSTFIGTLVGIGTFFYGLSHWHFKIITLVVISLIAGGLGFVFGLMAIGVAALFTIFALIINLLF